MYKENPALDAGFRLAYDGYAVRQRFKSVRGAAASKPDSDVDSLFLYAQLSVNNV